MQRKQQEQLERKIEDVQAQNSKLETLVDMSKVSAVEAAEKERDIALRKLKAEKEKMVSVDKKHKDEVGKLNKKYRNQINDLKKAIDFWRIATVVSLIVTVVLAFRFIG